MDTLFQIAILVMSVVIHEVSHGYAAEILGDPTARLQGRLTLNPLKHLDPVGSIIVPLLTSLSGFTFGWAKPVPYNPHNLRNQKWGELAVAGAGPLANILLVIIFGLLIRFAGATFGADFANIAAVIIVINLVLAIFNLIPVPPLDGSKILWAFLPERFRQARESMERYSFLLVIVVIFTIWQFLSPLIVWLFSLITGFPV
ncbi:MAG: Peptidase M50 [Parcubacteria group bacterium GW2011_GWB1_44_7]|nr:MAG: Peptidase M50 [Parcubacteria group bacterium GW2011_GWB1_44_7]